LARQEFVTVKLNTWEGSISLPENPETNLPKIQKHSTKYKQITNTTVGYIFVIIGKLHTSAPLNNNQASD
jgi:hypothetical protein